MKFPLIISGRVGFQPAGRGILPLPSTQQSAFSLVEVTVAVGIAGFCLLAIFGLLPVGLNSNNASIDQTTAANLARGVVSDIRATTKTSPPTKQKSPYYQIELPDKDAVTHTLFLKEDGSPSGTIDSPAVTSDNPRFRVMITCVAPATATSKNATSARILITWPALADTNPTTGATNPPTTNLPTKFTGSYEVVTALDRN